MSTSARPVNLAQLRKDIQQVMQENPDLDVTELDAVVQRQTGGAFATVAALTAAPATPAPAGPGLLSRVIDAARRGPSPEVTAARGNVAAGQNPLGTDLARNPATAQGLTRSLARGATLNFDNELANMLGVGQGPGGMYSPEGEASFRQFQKDRPGLDLLGNVVGGLPTGGLLGTAAKKALAAQATRMATTAANAGKPLGLLGDAVQGLARGQGVAPAVIGGVGTGSFYGGMSALGDDRPASQVVGATVLGGIAGGLIPALTGAGKNRGALGSQAIGERRLAGRTGMIGNATQDPAGTGLPYGAPPLTRMDKIRDALNPSRRVDRTEQGLAMLDLERQAQERMGRTNSTVLDYEPQGTNNVLTTEAANAIRGNQEAAAIGGVTRLATRNEQLGSELNRDFLTVAPTVMGGPGNIAASRVGRAAEVARVAERASGPTAPIIAPAGLGKRVPSVAGYNPDRRSAEIAQNLKAFAASDEGYAGLAPVIQPGSAGQGTSPEVLDRIRYNLANAEQANPTAPFRGVQRMLSMIQGGADEATPVTMTRVQETLATVNELIEASRLARGTPGRIALDAPESAALLEARDVITKYADDGFRGPQGQTFSDISREYAKASEAIRKLDEGRALVRGTVSGESGASPERSLQLWNEATPEAKAELRVGGIGQLLEDLRAATKTEVGGVITNLTQRATAAYRQNAVLQQMFPSKQAFDAVVLRQSLYDAADAGAAAFTTTSAAELQTAMRGLGSAAEKREFQRYMQGQFTDRLQTAESAASLLSQFTTESGVVPRSGPQWEKLRVMFGDAAPSMAQRMERAAARFRVSKTIGEASRNVSAARAQDVPADITSSRSTNPWNAAVNLARRRLGLDLDTQAKNLVAETLTTPNGLGTFSEMVRRASAPTQIGLFSRGVLPGMAGQYLGGGPQDEQP